MVFPNASANTSKILSFLNSPPFLLEGRFLCFKGNEEGEGENNLKGILGGFSIFLGLLQKFPKL